jgi:nucleotide-binding universal stress UspA family protein
MFQVDDERVWVVRVFGKNAKELSMSEFGRIVVGVDGSEGSIRALRWALGEARLRGAAVDVIHSWHVPYYPDISGTVGAPIGALADGARELLANVVAAVAEEAAGIDLTSHVDEAPGAMALIEASKQADLLVVGRRGHGGFISLVMGSVATEVSSHSECVVVIVGPARA